MKGSIKAKFLLLVLTLLTGSAVYSQRYLSEYDSLLFVKDTLRPFLKRMENLSFSAYIQPQFQATSEKGIDSYAGGDFREFSNNRFMLRRARLKIDYRVPGKRGDFPAALFTFQFEATERDVNVRDMFVRIFEPRHQNFSLTAGLFARPFGYEVNLSSSYRESPERGRMSQILMPSERDLGAMVSYESQKQDRKPPSIKFDIGLFNGQGKSGPAEFDSYKDIISRLSLKPFQMGDFSIGAGISLLRGGWVQATRYRYKMDQSSSNKAFVIDSSLDNIGKKAPRHYYGADLQLVYKYANGAKTELRGEYWRGTQPGSEETTVNPGTLPEMPTYIRNFDGAFFYLLQNIVNEKWEIIAKYDWYDPNIRVSGREIGRAGANLSMADIKFKTIGFGLTHYFTEDLKILAYYDIVRNEETDLPGFAGDLEDNVFTLRLQMKF